MYAIFDGHLDLAHNAMGCDRDLTLEVDDVRKIEANQLAHGRGRGTVTLPEMRRAGARVCLATVIARSQPIDRTGPVAKRKALDYVDPTAACAACMGQLAWYELMAERGEVAILRTAEELRSHWASDDSRIGVILLMEGADPIVTPKQVRRWWALGVRVVSLAHYGPSVYAMGTGGDGPLTQRGRELLEGMQQAGMVLDLTHTADASLAEALDIFEGPVVSTHTNCRAIADNDRQLTDDQIKSIAARSGVMGVVPHISMMRFPTGTNPETYDPPRDEITLELLVDHLDHICQTTGSADHAAIGSDLDGGFGTERIPRDMDRYRDLRRVADVMAARGYTDGQIAGVFGGNWLRFFIDALP